MIPLCERRGAERGFGFDEEGETKKGRGRKETGREIVRHDLV
jgi:hypothetical protein